jgi:hypothetical protein
MAVVISHLPKEVAVAKDIPLAFEINLRDDGFISMSVVCSSSCESA